MLLFRPWTLGCLLANGANGVRDIEGKVAREAMSECGQRASFNTFGVERVKRRGRHAPLRRWTLSVERRESSHPRTPPQTAESYRARTELLKICHSPHGQV